MTSRTRLAGGVALAVLLALLVPVSRSRTSAAGMVDLGVREPSTVVQDSELLKVMRKTSNSTTTALQEAHTAPQRAGRSNPRPRLVVSTTVAPPVQPPVSRSGSDAWAKLRNCESGGNYAENTGNGFYGAYQFESRTWLGVMQTLGFGHLEGKRFVATYPRADLAPPEIQDAAAHRLQAAAGWKKWPACSRSLGLR